MAISLSLCQFGAFSVVRGLPRRDKSRLAMTVIIVGWVSDPPKYNNFSGCLKLSINACRRCGGLKQRQAVAKTHPTVYCLSITSTV
ncbi:MAG: hypothetical protein J6M43_02610 [Neisseriaceae bacterium]|nr:hypothetical protein [Neisseriaceae bacterium]